jgi:prevent-host-death family protein
MKSISVSEFKTHALKIVSDVSKNQDQIIITKRGKPLAQIIPYKPDIKNIIPGILSHTLVFEEDVVSQLGEEMWDSCK